MYFQGACMAGYIWIGYAVLLVFYSQLDRVVCLVTVSAAAVAAVAVTTYTASLLLQGNSSCSVVVCMFPSLY